MSGIEEDATYPCTWETYAYYCHQIEEESLNWEQKNFGLYAELSVDDPPMESDTYDSGEHSLTQLWGIDRGGPSDEEFGYGAVPNVFGDYYSHLFVSYMDGGTYPYPFNPPAPYWKGESGSPYAPGNIVSEPGQQTMATFEIERYGNGAGGFNWWFYINGYWMGYFPESDWHHYFNTGFTEVQAGGEVAATSTSEPCIWMGNGAKGQESGAAIVTNAGRIYGTESAGHAADLYPDLYVEQGYEPGGYVAYNEGNTVPSTGTVRYGGVGWNDGKCP